MLGPYDVALTRRRGGAPSLVWRTGRSTTFQNASELVREFAVLIWNGIERGMPWLRSKVKDAPIPAAIARPQKTANIVERIARAAQTDRRLHAIAVTRSARQ